MLNTYRTHIVELSTSISIGDACGAKQNDRSTIVLVKTKEGRLVVEPDWSGGIRIDCSAGRASGRRPMS